MKVLQWIFIVIILLFEITNIDCTSFLKKENRPYAEVKYFRQCEVDKNSSHSLKLVIGMLYHAIPALNMDWTALIPFDDTYEGDVKLYKWSDGGWKNNFNLHRQKACSTLMSLFGDIWKEISAAANISRTCPISKGHYVLVNFTIPSTTALGPFLVWPGTFHLVLKSTQYGKVQICYELEIIIQEILQYGGKGLLPDSF